MDETKITNHMYVEFLHNIKGLVVKENTIRKNGQIWLVLGEVLEGYEPIVFKEGEFRIKPGAASNPVVRVSPIGAMAYARFYGRALPTMAQWWRAIRAEEKALQIVNPDRSAENGMMPPSSQSQRSEQSSSEDLRIRNVTAFESNQFGIWGLGRNVNEWTVYKPSEKNIEFHIHGGLGALGRQKAYLHRQPWEAFANVGFRTVLNLPSKEQ